MTPQIGIKLADGTFYPVMEDAPNGSEKLELTTVRNDQTSVQINLFKREDLLAQEKYIGSLIIEDIQKKIAGTPTIELALNIDQDNNLSATACDTDSGKQQALNVALKTLDSTNLVNSDFDLNTLEHGTVFDTDNDLLDDLDEDTEEESSQRLPAWLVILLVLLGIGLLVFLTFYLRGCSNTEASEPAVPNAIQQQEAYKNSLESSAVSLDTQSTENKQATQEPVTTEQEKSETPAVEKAQEEAKPATPEVPQSKKATTLRHKIKWGDTLWDISQTYYKTPWLYKKIARYNNIKNPDRIISGTYIEIPPR